MVIISHKHKFIYIKTRKTASTSLQVLLAKYCGKEDIITPIIDPTTEDGVLYNKRSKNYKGTLSYLYLVKNRMLSFFHKKNARNFFKVVEKFFLNGNTVRNLKGLFGKFRSHMSAERVKMKVGESIWNEYFKFTIERNPWDKLVSFYNHIKPDKSFEAWIKTIKLIPTEQPLNYPLYSINSKISLDFIGTYESLRKDLEYIFVKLSLPIKELPTEKTSYRKDKDNYRKYYNEKTKEIVEKNYNKEIKLFDYKF